MDLPTSGPIVENHNQMIIQPNDYSFFANNKTEGYRVVNTGFGSFLVAYSDQRLAQMVFDKVLGDQYTLLIAEEVTMYDFFNFIESSGQKKEGILGFFKQSSTPNLNGILLNLPIDFVSGHDDFIPNDRLLMHLFHRDEFQHFGKHP